MVWCTEGGQTTGSVVFLALYLRISNSPLTLLEDRFITNSGSCSSWCWNPVDLSTDLLQHYTPYLLICMTKFMMLLAQGLCEKGAMDWSYNLLGLPSFPLTWRLLPRWGGCWAERVCEPCSWRWYCCEPPHHLNSSLNLHSFLQCHLNLFHEDLFGFPRFGQSTIQTKKWACFLSECLCFRRALDSDPSRCSFMCGLALVYGNTFSSIFQFFSWMVKALSVISCSLHASSSAKLPPEWPRNGIWACAECIRQLQAKAKISCLARSQPKPYTCAWACVCVRRDAASGAC